jgi:hypothetical protein
MTLRKQLLCLFESNENHTVYHQFWKKFVEYSKTGLVEWKVDNALFLITEINQSILATKDIQPNSKEALELAGKLLSEVTLLAFQKKSDFIFEFAVDLYVPANALQAYWAPYMNRNKVQKLPTELVQDLLFLQARHKPNTDIFGTPYICDNGYNKILKRILMEILVLLKGLVAEPLHEIAICHMLRNYEGT